MQYIQIVYKTSILFHERRSYLLYYENLLIFRADLIRVEIVTETRTSSMQFLVLDKSELLIYCYLYFNKEDPFKEQDCYFP